ICPVIHPRDDASVAAMISQIVDLLIRELDGLADIDEKIAETYLEEAYKELEETYRLFDKVEVKMEVSHSVKRTFYKDFERDEAKIRSYAQVLKEALKKPRRGKVMKLPPWGKLVKTFEGKNFQNYLRRRAVTYTFQLLNKQGLTGYD
ncbi:hypothetical protein KEJ47_10095, partial [Candidatus Bathyarchaeota archaeon]|nr:hypothetical protein [Candidatus Bathyarchaeota archaeon]